MILLTFTLHQLKKQKLSTTYTQNKKIEEIERASANIRTLLNELKGLFNLYKINFPEKHLEFDWPNLINDFVDDYYTGLNEHISNGLSFNLRIISDEFLKPFIDFALKIKEIPFNPKSHEKIIEKASDLRKDIYNIEQKGIDFAKETEKNHITYFSENSFLFKRLVEITQKIDSKTEFLNN